MVESSKTIGQPEPSSVKQETPVSPPPFAPVFFEPSVSFTSYLPNNPKKVFEWVEAQISAVSGKPDQYSTSEERRKYESALTERMKPIGAIPFIGECQKKYDADRQTFEVKTPLFSIKDMSLKAPNPEALNLRRLSISRENVKQDSYTAQNAYGAGIEVSRTSSDDYVLAFPAGSTSEPSSILVQGSTSAVNLYRYTFHFLTFTVKMPPAEAREKDKQIACMYVFSLDAPYTFKFKERETPTRSLPFETINNGFALFGKLDQVAVINKVSGDLYEQSARQTAPLAQPTQVRESTQDEALVESMALDMKCNTHPVAARTAARQDYSEYSVYCSKGNSQLFQCNSGKCRPVGN